jgi:hypothetical protein
VVQKYFYLKICLPLPTSSSILTISNPKFLSSCETEVNPGIRSWKYPLSDWVRCQKAIGGIYFTKKWRAETVQLGLEFDDFKPWPNSCIYKYSSCLDASILRAMMGVFWKRESRPVYWLSNVAYSFKNAGFQRESSDSLTSCGSTQQVPSLEQVEETRMD